MLIRFTVKEIIDAGRPDKMNMCHMYCKVLLQQLNSFMVRIKIILIGQICGHNRASINMRQLQCMKASMNSVAHFLGLLNSNSLTQQSCSKFYLL